MKTGLWRFRIARITGTETFTDSETGNSANQTYENTITGTGSYTLTGTGISATPGPGSYSYEKQETADAKSGVLNQTQTGTTRYNILERYNDVSNTGGGNTPGNMNFLPYGQPFVDPDPNKATAKGGPEGAGGPIAKAKGSTVMEATSATICSKMSLVIVSGEGRIADMLASDKRGKGEDVSGRQVVLDALNANPGHATIIEMPAVSTMGDVAKEIKKFAGLNNAVITIEGHCGGGKPEPGLKLQKDMIRGEVRKNGIDLTNLNKKDGAAFVGAVETALVPGGVLRIVSCGYRNRPGTKWEGAKGTADWEENVDTFASRFQLKGEVVVVFSTGDVAPHLRNVLTLTPTSVPETHDSDPRFGGWWVTTGKGKGFWIPAVGKAYEGSAPAGQVRGN